MKSRLLKDRKLNLAHAMQELAHSGPLKWRSDTSSKFSVRRIGRHAMKSFGSLGFGASVGGCGGVGGGAGGASAGGGSNDWQQVAAWENFRRK